MWNVEKLFPLITAEVQTAAGGSLEMVSSDAQSSSDIDTFRKALQLFSFSG